MNASMKSILAFAVLLTIGCGARAEYDVDAYCQLVKNGVKLGSIENCQTYYTCTKGKAIKTACPSSQAFDKNFQSCRPQSDVKCYFGVDKPCVGIVDGYVPIVNTCNGFIYCKNNAEVGRGRCGGNLIFHDGECRYGDCNTNIDTGTTNKGLTSVCEIMPDNEYFGSTKDCDTWQKCVAGELKFGSCKTPENNFVYDVQTGLCSYESGNMCSRVTGEDIQPDGGANSCTTNNAEQPDSSKCSFYQVCTDGKWQRVPCAAGKFYDVIVGKCQDRQIATPQPGCDRCEYSKRQFVNAVDPKCNKYLTCSNGVKTSNSGNCPPNHYFDEKAQACVADSNGFTNYVDNNGACFNTCPRTCQAESSNNCQVTSDCDCGLDGNGECDECKIGVDTISGKCIVCADICKALESGKCSPTNGCECGLDGTAKCSECANGIDADTKKCKTSGGAAPTKTCQQTCEGITNSTKCKPTTVNASDCKCGLKSNSCTECPESVDSANKCVTHSAYCSGLTTALCKSIDGAVCGLTKGACALCTEGLDTSDSTKCA